MVRILLLISAFVGTIWLVQLLHRELIWVGVAFFLAVALDPAVSRLAKLLHTGRLIATTLVFAAFLALLVFLGVSLVPPLISQSEALVTQIPHLLQQIQNSHGYTGYLIQHFHLVDQAKAAQARVLSDLTAGSGTAIGVLVGFFSGLAATVTTLVIAFFMLLEGPHWITLGFRYIPVSEQSHFHRIATKMYRIVSGYVTGNLIVAALIGVSTAIVIAILGVPYAIPLGILTGLSTLVPVIGGGIGLIAVCGVAIFTSVSATIILAIYFTVYIFIDGHVLKPVIYGKTVDMSPLLVMIAIIFGTALAGIVGALISIPVAACLGVLLTELAEDYAPPAAHT